MKNKKQENNVEQIRSQGPEVTRIIECNNPNNATASALPFALIN
jgi:hypothetical protein